MGTKTQMLERENLDLIDNSRIIENNTLRIEYVNGDVAIRLHNTNVVTLKKNEDIVLSSGGWRTQITKDRINKYSFVRIISVKGIWYIADSDIIFYDGITFDKRGALTSKNRGIDLEKIKKIKKDISEYVKLIDKVDKLPKPGNGNCFDCALGDDVTGKCLGDLKKDNSHLKSHIKEGYLHGSILFNAMREKNFTDRQIIINHQLDIRDNFKRALRKYLYKRLLVA